MKVALDAAGIRAILLDIEGTTTPLDFVHKTLFPYARARLADFLRANHSDASVRADLEALRREHAAEPSAADLPPWRDDSPDARLRSAVAYLNWLMDRDRKSTALKSLQGRIWEAGYRSGELRGDVYPDVPLAFDRWHRQGRRLAIFSSGSVLAQQLLFAHSTAGDLALFISAFFDTTTGPKQSPASYGHIAAALSLSPGEILFLSDVLAELDAARSAGLATALCLRSTASDASAPTPSASSHPILHSFVHLFP